MKSPLTIFALCTVLFALGATLFAQTTTGSSLITEMKAGLRDFTLAGQLNPGITGLQSAPVGGKKTGDMLTAGEYNRILELVGQGGGGGGGGFTTTLFDDITDGLSNGGVKTYTCPEGQFVLSVTSIMIPSGQYSCANSPNADKKSVSYNSCAAQSGQRWHTHIICGGGGGGSTQSNIIKGTTSAAFYNGQPHSTMAAVSFGRTCTNPVILVQSVSDSIGCGSGTAAGICANDPSTTSQDLHAYFGSVTSTGFQAYLSGASGVWVGAASPAFGINYIVACDGGGGGATTSCPSNATGTYPNCICPNTSSLPYGTGLYDIKPFLYKYNAQKNTCDQWSYRVKAAGVASCATDFDYQCVKDNVSFAPSCLNCTARGNCNDYNAIVQDCFNTYKTSMN